jgi:hypothetical protein
VVRVVAVVCCVAASACGRIDFTPVEVESVPEPVTMLTALAEPSLIASDDTRIYWTSFADQVLACAKADCSGTLAPVASPAGTTPHGIAVDANRVYWTRSGAEIAACPLAGCGAAAPTVIASGFSSAYFLAVDATTVYWTDDLDGTILSCPLTGCGATPTVFASGEASPHGIAVTDTDVYWAVAGTGADGAIRSCPKTGCGGAPATLASNLAAPWFIAIDASSNIYWSERTGGGQVSGCPIAGCAGAVTIYGDYGFGIYVDDRGIYYSGESNLLSYASFDGSGPVHIWTEGSDTRGVTGDADFVYWVDRGAGTLMKLAKHDR